MAAPVVVGVTSGGVAGTPATTDTMTYPTGIVSTDLVLCVISWRNQGTVDTVLTVPTGFTALTGATTSAGTVAGSHRTWVGWRLGTGGGTGLTFSAGTLDSWAILRISGAHQTTPINAQSVGSANAASTTTATIASKAITTTVADCLVLHAYAARVNSTTGVTVSFTPPASTTEATDFARPVGGTTNIVGQEVVYETQAVAGAATSRTTTAVPSTAGTAIYPNATAIAIAPAAATATQYAAAGTVDGTSTTTGAATSRLSGSGTVAASSTVAGAATVISAPTSTQYPAAGVVAATSTTTGAAALHAGAAGVLAATSTTSGAAGIRTSAAGVAAASSSVTGAATIRAVAAGSVTATSDTTGAASLAGKSYAAAGTVAVVSSATGAAGVLVYVPPPTATPSPIIATPSLHPGTTTPRHGRTGQSPAAHSAPGYTSPHGGGSSNPAHHH